MTEEGRRVYSLALRDLYASRGAQPAERSGWLVPGHFGDGGAEYRAIREGAALIDRSSRSRFMVTGTDALDVLDAVFAGEVRELEEGRCMRAAIVDEQGIVRDVALIARTGGIAYLVSGEPGQREETRERLTSAVQSDYDARVDDRTEGTCLIALVGPNAAGLAAEHLAEGLSARMQGMHCSAFQFHGFRSLAMRTSDTGEDGFEMMLAPAVAQHLIETLTEAGAVLAGEDAHETARVEACIPAFDPDLLGGLTPAEADLDVLLGIDGGASERILTGLLGDDGQPFAAGDLVLADGVRIGEVRSSVRSPAVGATIALAVVESSRSLPGAEFVVSGRRTLVVAKPFLRRRR